MVLAIAHTVSYTKSAVLDFVSRKTVAHFATALIRYVFRYFGLGSLSLTRRPTQNPLSWILFHEKQSLISQPLSFAIFFATSCLRFASHYTKSTVRMTFLLFVKFSITVRYLLNDSVFSPKTVI